MGEKSNWWVWRNSTLSREGRNHPETVLSIFHIFLLRGKNTASSGNWIRVSTEG
jgi:hypothetical protein